jgi:CheY-like chemotaxis protein
MYNWDNKSILIADDDFLNFELLKLILRNTNVSITHFTDGQAVIDYINDNNNCDMIIMDIQMPILDGISATIKLREIGITIPIVALTALNTISEKSKYEKYGFNEIVEKPVRKDMFLKMIERYLNN